MKISGFGCNILMINYSFILSMLVVIAYIIGGNSLTFDISDRFPVKIAEIISIPLIIANFNIISLERYELRIIGWLILGLVSTGVCALFFSYELNEVLYGILYTVRIAHLLILTNIIAFHFREKKVNTIELIKKLYLIVCLIGYWQVVYYPVAFDYYAIFQEIGVNFKNPDPHIGRLLSTYFDPNFLAACLIIPYTLSLSEWKKSGGMKNLMYIVFYTITIILTVSRSGLLGIFIVTVFISFNIKYSLSNIKRVLLILLGTVLALVSSILLSLRLLERLINSSSDGSTWARFQSWNLGLEIWSESPFIGIGYNMIGAFTSQMLGSSFLNSTGYGNDSSLLVVLISTGIFGFLYVIWAFFKDIADLKIYNLDERAKAYIAFGISSLVICNFNNLLFYPLWLFPVLLLRKMVYKTNKK